MSEHHAPSVLGQTGTGEGLRLTWAASTRPGFCAYRVYRAEQAGMPGALLATPTQRATTTLWDLTARSGTAYWYTVTETTEDTA